MGWQNVVRYWQSSRSPEQLKTASEAVASLRLWKRQAQHAEEFRITMPDTVLQVKALSTIMEQLLAADAQAAFRVNAYSTIECNMELKQLVL